MGWTGKAWDRLAQARAYASESAATTVAERLAATQSDFSYRAPHVDIRIHLGG